MSSELEQLKAENQKLKLQLTKAKADGEQQASTFKDLIQKLYKELQESTKAHQDFKDKVASERKQFEEREKELQNSEGDDAYFL